MNKTKNLRKKKPSFTRQSTTKKIRLSSSWRRPKGLQSKLRLRKKGHKQRPSPGWGSPKKTRYLVGGILPRIIHSFKEMRQLEKGVGIVIPSNVGQRRKKEIAQYAKENNITIINLHADNYLKKVEQDLAERKKKVKKVKLVEEPKKKEKKTEKKEEPKLSEEDRKKKEKEEQDKVLTKKD